jgi:arylsulfatase A-like enzyme
VIALVTAACDNGAEPSEPVRSATPSLVIIALDTTRADHLTVYGYPRLTSPALQRLAWEGARFDRAYAPSASTAPSHASLFTGRDPLAHGVQKNGLALDERNETLAELLAGAGFQTAAVVSSFVLNRKFGFAQGFEFYDADFAPGEATVSTNAWEGHPVARGAFDRRGDHTTRRAIRWLRERDADRPFFLFVHYFDPHLPYGPPEPYLSRFGFDGAPVPLPRKGEVDLAVRRYDGEVAFVDAQVARLMEALEVEQLTERTLVVVTADHGEGLMDHGILSHGVFLYDEAVRIPLIMRWPGELAAGTVISEPVTLLDIVPTVLELLRLPGAPRLPHGRSLATALRGEAILDPGRRIYFQRRPYERQDLEMWGKATVEGSLFGIRSGRWKYVEGTHDDTRELFDLDSDPGELRNLSAERMEEAAEQSRRIDTWRRSYPALAHDVPALSESDREALESLGYVE